jgi:hypothetical protein
MLSSRYLKNLEANPLGTFPGIFEITDLRKPGSYRFVATYEDGNRHKDAFFAFLARHGQVETPSEWHFHHVVEGHHFADIDYDGRLDDMYDSELPCVLIHQDEHTGYTRQARLRGTSEMHRERGLKRRKADRSVAARKAGAAAVADAALRTRLMARVQRLRGYYRDLHAEDEVVRRLADNVLMDVLERLGH